MRNEPLVSIGMAVFNGEKFLRKAIDSILAQTFTDFELIISDNASTDLTPNICKEYVSKDNRVRYYRNDTNMGAPRNFNRAFRLSKGKYFKWAAADDVHAKDYLQKCVDILEKDPTIVLCHSKTAHIDEYDQINGEYNGAARINSTKPHERIANLLSIIHTPCWLIFGLSRTSLLKNTSLHGCYWGSDRNLLVEIALIGRMYEIPEHLFFGREHSQAFTKRYAGSQTYVSKSDLQQVKAWNASESWIDVTCFRSIYKFFESVSRLPLKRSERILCYNQLTKWFIKEGWLVLGGDLERYLLSRSSLGRNSIKVAKNLMRHIGIQLISKEN